MPIAHFRASFCETPRFSRSAQTKNTNSPNAGIDRECVSTLDRAVASAPLATARKSVALSATEGIRPHLPEHFHLVEGSSIMSPGPDYSQRTAAPRSTSSRLTSSGVVRCWNFRARFSGLAWSTAGQLNGCISSSEGAGRCFCLEHHV